MSHPSLSTADDGHRHRPYVDSRRRVARKALKAA
jgi:hypothetical protein